MTSNPERPKSTECDDNTPFAVESIPSPQILRNAKGGVLVTRDQIRAAFDFFDVDHKGAVTMENLKSRLGVFYKDMTTRDFRVLLNNEAELTEQTLCDLLLENDIADYDPVAEAFRAFDPDNTGYVSYDILSRLFESLGYGKLSDDDLRVLIATADADKDGHLNLSDFRNMLTIQSKYDMPLIFPSSYHFHLVNKMAPPSKQSASTLLYGVFTPECFDAYFTKFDFLQVECGKAVVSKLLGYLIILGSFILKLPQILKIVAAGNVAGLNPSSFYLEVITFQATVVYNVLRGYPISTWGESAVILVQNIILVVLLWVYSKSSRSTQLLGALTFLALGAGMFNLPAELHWILPSAGIPLSVMARIPQIISNFQQGHTGQLAFLTLFLNFGGSAARLFTTLQETGDQVVLLGFGISLLLNGTLLTQILIYWKATDAALAKAKDADKKKK